MNNWTNYLFTADFSPCADALNQLTTGQLIEGTVALNLAGVLQQCDVREGKANWVPNGTTEEWNLDQARVVYAGPNNRDLPTNSKYQRVVILQFPASRVKPVGRIYLQYNLPSGV